MIKKTLALFSAPLILLTAYLVLYLGWKLLGLPSDEVMKNKIISYFANYGLVIVFVGAFLEGVLLIGQYFPGGFIIFFGVISAGANVLRAAEIVAIVCISFFIAYYLNYLIGKYGWYRLLLRFGLGKTIEITKEKLAKHELSTILSTYWEPNLSSITATAAGILQIPRRRFLIHSIIGILIWETFWGILVFFLGRRAFNLFGIKSVLLVFAVWTIIILIKHFGFDKKNRVKSL